MFDNVLQFTDREDTNVYNILTGLFKSNVEEVFYLFILKENNSAKNLLMKGFGWRRVNNQHLGSIKKPRLIGMKYENAKDHYVAKGKLHQLERHCDFRTIVVCNTIPGSNINIK